MLDCHVYEQPCSGFVHLRFELKSKDFLFALRRIPQRLRLLLLTCSTDSLLWASRFWISTPVTLWLLKKRWATGDWCWGGLACVWMGDVLTVMLLFSSSLGCLDGFISSSWPQRLWPWKKSASSLAICGLLLKVTKPYGVVTLERWGKERAARVAGSEQCSASSREKLLWVWTRLMSEMAFLPGTGDTLNPEDDDDDGTRGGPFEREYSRGTVSRARPRAVSSTDGARNSRVLVQCCHSLLCLTIENIENVLFITCLWLVEQPQRFIVLVLTLQICPSLFVLDVRKCDDGAVSGNMPKCVSLPSDRVPPWPVMTETVPSGNYSLVTIVTIITVNRINRKTKQNCIKIMKTRWRDILMYSF